MLTLQFLPQVIKANEPITPEGWPLTLGGSGLVLRLGELEASALRLGECYLCVRSADAAKAQIQEKEHRHRHHQGLSSYGASEAGTTAASAADAANSGRNFRDEDSDEQSRNCDGVEIALVWRSSPMRAPGILGWEQREEHDLMEARAHHESRSTERYGCASRSSHQPRLGNDLLLAGLGSTTTIGSSSTSTGDKNDSIVGHHDVMKSRSASSVDAWAEEARAASERRSTSSGRCDDEDDPDAVALHGPPDTRNKLKRNTRVVSPSAMEKWKETSRCETRSRILAPRDLADPGSLESSLNLMTTNTTTKTNFKDRQLNGEQQTSLHQRPDDVSDLDLPSYINTLLVTVERKIERVSIDDLTFPCVACRNIDTDDPLLGCKCAGDTCDCDSNDPACECASVKDEKIEARSFEVAGIKHIDSDDEEEVRMGF
ncbi:hypothetical protein QAD02_006416, partial [Eretmocerus hayati]